jgi:hypothetical protein
MSGSWNSPTSPSGYTPPTGLTSFGQTSGSPQLSPLTGAAERGALEALMNIANGAGSSQQGTFGGPDPTGAPSTGSFRGDVEGAYGAGMFGPALNAMANPTGMITSIPATMAAIGLNAITGVPAKGLSEVMGLRGLMNQIANIPQMNALQSYAMKPDDFVGVDPNQSKNDPGLGVDFGFGVDGDTSGGTAATGGAAPGTDNANSNSTAAGQDAAGPGDGDNFAGGGLIALAGGGKIATGPGGGLDDLIPTSIDGRRAAALSDGEFVVPADVVSMFGDGSSAGGARRLYDLVRSVRENKTGTSQQAGPLPIGDILKRSLR